MESAAVAIEARPETFDWARELNRKVETCLAKVVKHDEMMNQLHVVLSENKQLKAALAESRAEVEELRKQLHQQRVAPPPPTIVLPAEIAERGETVHQAFTSIAELNTSAQNSKHATNVSMPPTTSAPQSRLYATVAAKHRPTTRAQRRNLRRTGPPTEGMISWAIRIFTPPTIDADPGYTMVYMPSPRRTQHGEVRRALALLGVPQACIIDIHFPVRGIIGLLIHRSFDVELRSLLRQAKINPKDDFNPVAANTVTQTEHAEKTEEERVEQARTYYRQHMLRACLRMPKVHLGWAILRHYHYDVAESDPHHIDAATLEAFANERPRPQRPQPRANSAAAARALFSSSEEAPAQDDGMDITQ